MNALTEACREGWLVNIYCDTVVSNKDQDDGKQLGAASAVLYHEGRECKHIEKVFGESVTETDTQIRSLTPGLNALTAFLATKPMQHQTLAVFLIPFNLALTRALDASPHEEQSVSMGHLTILGELFTTYPNIQVRLQWLPRKVPFIGFQRARQLAFEAIHIAVPTEILKPQSIKKQKETTKHMVIATWEDRYYSNPRSSMAFKTALQSPSDGKTHHTFNISPSPGERHGNAGPNKHPRDQENKAKFSRLTHSTLLRYITGHAFTGEYTKRFYPLHTQEQITCPCGEPLQTVEHMLTECMLYTATRRRYLTTNSWPRTLPKIFANSKCVQEVLCFLEETGACVKPWARWEPG